MPRKSAKTKDRNKKKVKVNERKRSLLSPAESEDSTTCDAILATRSDLGEEETMTMDAKDAFEQALNEDELRVEVGVTGETVVGNRRGLNLATRLFALEKQVASQDIKIASQDIKVASHEAEIVELRDLLLNLRLSLKEYRQVRNRFISTFKRDKLHNADGSDISIIQEGNLTAHGGDAVFDAMLYQGLDGRRDYAAFTRLYGVDPSIVPRIKHKPTIAVMNIHASIISSQYKVGSDVFYAKFAEFVRHLGESGYDESYLDGGATDVTRAYWEFHKCIDDEVTG